MCALQHIARLVGARLASDLLRITTFATGANMVEGAEFKIRVLRVLMVSAIESSENDPHKL